MAIHTGFVMEADKNPMPAFDLFPRLHRVASFLGRAVSFLPTQAPDHMSNHYRGGAAMLDRELYDNGQMEFDYGTDEQTL